MDSTAVCNMAQDYTPHFGTNYSTPQGPPPLTPTDIFERPRNRRKSSYPSGLVSYQDEINGGKDYYMDMDDNSVDDTLEQASPKTMSSVASEGASKPTYLDAPQNFTSKISPNHERGPLLSPTYPMNGNVDEKFGSTREQKFMMSRGQDKVPMLSPEQKYQIQNGGPDFASNERSENHDKFQDERFQMFNEMSKAQYDSIKFQEKYPEMLERQFSDFSPDQQVPARSPGSSERAIKQEPSSPPPPLTSPAGLKIPYPPMLSDLSPNSFNDLSPNKFPEQLNGFAHDQPLDFSTKLKDEFYTTTQAPPPPKSPDERKEPEKNPDGSANFNCKHCHRPFKSQVNLDRHVEKSHNPKSSKIFSCLLCPYTTRFYSNMYVHIRTHTGDKPYWCGACGASFSQGSSLKIHIISKHGGNKKYFILDRKLGKANLLRFWQRREASQVNGDNENDFKPDFKKFNGFPNGFPNMMNMNGADGAPPMPGLEKVETQNTQIPNGVQNPLMGNHVPMNNIGNLFPNGMNMFSPMNPLGLNLMGQNPLGPNPMLFGNNNLLLQQSLMNGLNLKNSAFFTKTTKYSDERDGNPDKSQNNSQQPNFYGDLQEQMSMKQNSNPLAGLLQNGKMSPTKMRFPEFTPNSLAGGLPPFGPLPPIGGSIPVSLATTLPSQSLASMMPIPPLMTSPGQATVKDEERSPKSRSDSPAQPKPENDDNTTVTKQQPAKPTENGISNQPVANGNQTSANTTRNLELCERKLRDLRRDVVKMLRMMVPDLQMDKNMNQEGEDVDMLLKEVIWSTATEMEGVTEEHML